MSGRSTLFLPFEFSVFLSALESRKPKLTFLSKEKWKRNITKKRAKETDFPNFISERLERNPFRKFRSIVRYCNKAYLEQNTGAGFNNFVGFLKAGYLATRKRAALIGLHRLRWQFASYFVAVSHFCRTCAFWLESHGRDLPSFERCGHDMVRPDGCRPDIWIPNFLNGQIGLSGCGRSKNNKFLRGFQWCFL